MDTNAIQVEDVWKKFRIYHERNQYLKSTLLHGRRARYNDFWALQGVSIEIPFGATFGIIGSNGSGKSTLLKCLSGILSPDRGRMTISGRVAALLELGAGFHPELSGRENIFLNGAILGMSNREINRKLDDMVSFAGLGQFLDSPVKNYSSGMVVRLGFAVAINVDPEILIIDEVLAVGDESFQQKCYEKIEEFRRDGRTIVLVSHGLSQVTQLCEKVAWIDKGHLREVGPSYEVVGRYTGISHDAIQKTDGEIGDRWGTQEVSISSVELLNSRGNSVRVLNSGEQLLIRISFDSPSPVRDVVCGVRITHLHGQNVWGTNTKRRAYSIPTLHGSGYIDLTVPSLSLLEGTYDLTVALSDMSEVNVFDHWEKRIRFDVRQDSIFDEGLIYFEAVWSMEGT